MEAALRWRCARSLDSDAGLTHLYRVFCVTALATKCCWMCLGCFDMFVGAGIPV